MARLIVISGPSGAGKGTLIAEILPHFDRLAVSTSVTTRGRRAGEREGRDYYFVPRSQFLRRVEDGQFLEWAEYGGNLYGTPVAEVESLLQTGYDVILEIELKGARQVLESVPDSVLIFVAPPDLEELEQRLRRRSTDTDEAIARRMTHARDEMAELARDAGREPQEFDYVIVNDDVEQAAWELRRAIQEIRARDPARGEEEL